MFSNRTSAGKQLADKLERYLLNKPGFDRNSLVIVGLPRGGVPVALEVARRFSCPVDILYAKKLPYPGQPEYAIGAVSSDGVVVLQSDTPNDKRWQQYVNAQRENLLKRTKEAENELYRLAGRTKSSFDGKSVIIVDDGIATGMTAMAAAETSRKRGAIRTILAVPVMSNASFRELSSHCDDVVALSTPSNFSSVGQHYVDFSQTTNEEVIKALQESMAFLPININSKSDKNGLNAIGQ